MEIILVRKTWMLKLLSDGVGLNRIYAPGDIDQAVTELAQRIAASRLPAVRLAKLLRALSFLWLKVCRKKRICLRAYCVRRHRLWHAYAKVHGHGWSNS